MASSAQVTCLECGAIMLAATAIRTGGTCMACKQGIRKNIEASKIYYEKRKQPDPFRDHWTALVHQVHNAPDGVHRLSHQEQTYFLGCILEGEVYNGGMHQFFSNNSGDYYRETLQAMNDLRADNCHALLLAAKQVLFPDCEPPRERTARYAMMPPYPTGPISARPTWDLELDRIDEEFYTDPDGLGDRLRRYALDHHLVQL